MKPKTATAETIQARLAEANTLIEKLCADEAFQKEIEQIAEKVTDCFKSGKKLLICGNGGSATDAEHLAAEFSGRFQFDRPPLNAEALHVNAGQLTAIANDLSFDKVFSRLVRAKAKPGDLLIAMTTSGNSTNVINALIEAGANKMKTVLLTGKNGGIALQYSDFAIRIPSENTARIQEMHLLVGHIICELVESNLF
ncbi:MAG: SIS domain-containing protein [Saprospirales bacterium]|nr:MAG: SIS domain-containing protein [Saprospirales bacterium]